VGVDRIHGLFFQATPLISNVHISIWKLQLLSYSQTDLEEVKMFDRDAEGAREATEQGKRNMRLKDLMESIMYELNECQKFGQSNTRYKLSDEDITEFKDVILERLEERGYSVDFQHPYLVVSWELQEK
jgi:hypothetical protein